MVARPGKPQSPASASTITGASYASAQSAPLSIGSAARPHDLRKGDLPPLPLANLAIASLSTQRLRHFSLHGFLAVKVAAPPFEQDGAFSWIIPLPEHHTGCDNITWYCDGSLIDGRRNAIRCSGFGLAAVSSNDDLIAYGLGWPPSWCDTAASAEAWAMLTVLAQCPFVPPIRTDCQALLTTALAGNASASHRGRPLARVWSKIVHAHCR